MTGRRVLITGVSRFLGLRLAKRLEEDDDVELVIGVDLQEPPLPVKKMDFVRVDIRNPLIARVLETTKVDTLIHTNISSSPGRLGGRSQMKENNVIGTMQLFAAAQRTERLQRVVMKSSTAIYGSSPRDPSLLPEDHASRQVDLSGYGKDCAEAEQYARDFGRRRPDVDLMILRTQNVVGPTVKTSMTDYLSLPVMPTALGFDPRLQFLHEQDAVEALYLALKSTATGIYNIAGDGVVYLSQAIRQLQRVELPILLPAATTAANLLRRFGVIDFPTDQLKLMLFGRVVDIRRAKERLGFEPAFSTAETLRDFRDHRNHEVVPEPNMRPTWERELFEFLKQQSEQRQTV